MPTSIRVLQVPGAAPGTALPAEADWCFEEMEAQHTQPDTEPDVDWIED